MAEIENKVTEEVTEKKEAKTTKASKPVKNKEPLGKRIAKAFREFKAEFKKIVWSSKKATFSNTALVVACMVIVAVVIGLLDTGFSTLLNWIAGLI